VACPRNFEGTSLHNLIREAKQLSRVFWKPSLWGYKLFYERRQWDPDPRWACNPENAGKQLPDVE
jgi:hypothetical protein